MSELDLLRAVGDQVVPPHRALRETARRRNRRTRMATATAAVAASAIVAVSGLVGAEALRDASPPDERPADHPGEPGIPAEIHHPAGDGGLELEGDLAVGRASVAIANDTGAFVITADDGVYHRLDLPGFDPALYAAGGSEVSGLAVSPDGTKLVYGWQGAAESPKASGARLVDLLTGEVTTLDRQSLYDEPARLLPWGSSTVPHSRYVINRVKIADPGRPVGLEPALAAGARHRDRAQVRRFRAHGRPRARDGRRAREHGPGHLLPARDPGRLPRERAVPRRLQGRPAHGARRPRRRPDHRLRGLGHRQVRRERHELLLEPDRIAGSLALVRGLAEDGGPDPRTSARRLTDGPADVRLLGWVGRTTRSRSWTTTSATRAPISCSSPWTQKRARPTGPWSGTCRTPTSQAT